MRTFLVVLAAITATTTGLVAPDPARAQTSNAIVVSACGTVTRTYVVGQPYPLTVDTNGNLCGGSGGGGGGVVSGNVGGYDSGSSPTQTATAPATVNAGSAIVSLITIPLARTAGGSGEAENFLWTSVGGYTGAIVFRAWDKLPASTTCTGGSAFSGSAADDAHLIVTPFSGSPTAPASTTGDSKTYLTVQFTPPLSFKNQDTSPTVNIYVCAVAVVSDTADASKAVYANFTGPQN